MQNAKFKMQNVKTRPEWEFVILHFSLCIALATSAGCSYLFYPKASEVLEKAKGASGVETILNLTTMLKASAKAARGGQGYDAGLNDLHNQFHALDKAFCQVTKEQASTPAYAKAVTINRRWGRSSSDSGNIATIRRDATCTWTCLPNVCRSSGRRSRP